MSRVATSPLGILLYISRPRPVNGYVMGKKIGAQSIVVSRTATRQVGREAEIFRFALKHSVALTAPVGAIVTLCAWAIPWAVLSSP